MSPVSAFAIIASLAVIPGLVAFIVTRHHARRGLEPAEAQRIGKHYARLTSIPVYLVMFTFIGFLVIR